jgi:hypothetical protein
MSLSGPPRVYITESEHAALITAAGTDHAVPTAFGGGRVWIATGTPDTTWALRQIAAMRGIEVS